LHASNFARSSVAMPYGSMQLRLLFGCRFALRIRSGYARFFFLDALFHCIGVAQFLCQMVLCAVNYLQRCSMLSARLIELLQLQIHLISDSVGGLPDLVQLAWAGGIESSFIDLDSIN
jgi:hypothetical protein